MGSRGDRSPIRQALDSYTVGEILLLLPIMVSLGIALVPCRAIAFWGYGEFSGWVVPIGNRIAQGQQLYTDGGHLPLPPLSFVLSSLLFGSGGLWIHESLLNFILQCLTLLILYIGLSRLFPKPIPFFAVLGTVPIFFSLWKSIIYDPLAQMFVAAVAVTGAAQLSARSAAPPGHDAGQMRTASGSRRFGIAGLAGLAGLTAACLLSKQSTATGVLAGCCCALTVFPRSTSLGERLIRLMIYLGATLLALLGGCLILSPFISIHGFFVDVLLTGSEPKGGMTAMFFNLKNYASEIGESFTPARLVAVAMLVIGGLWSTREKNLETDLAGSRHENGVWWRFPAYLGALAGAGAGFAASSTFSSAIVVPLGFAPAAHLGWLPKHLMSTGLILSLVLPVLCLRFSPRFESRNLHALGVLSLLTFPPAVTHSLSGWQFRWTYDNNPLITIALCIVSLLVFQTLQRFLPNHRLAFAILVTLGSALLQLTLWSTLPNMFGGLEQCTETWPEVRYLQGAKLSKSASFLRNVIPIVRSLTPEPGDEMLYLPNDPDVEAWFDRPRPKLSGAIVWVDQYWDRYVDADFERLAKNPPKVIVISPRYSGPFMQTFWGAGGTGARRLTMRVILELFPRRYQLHSSVLVPGLRYPDYVDVWVRKPMRPRR